jgi:hypothetical protein
MRLSMRGPLGAFLGGRTFTFCGAEAPPFKAGVSAALSFVLYSASGLRHSGTPERDSSPMRTYPTERSRRSAGESASG